MAIAPSVIHDETSPAGPGAESVRLLFNEKAAEWQRKYAPGGPLALRLAQFEAALAAHVAPGARVLDLGCGTGNLAAHLARTHRLEAVDIAERMLSVARMAFGSSGVDWHLIDPCWRRLPYEDGSFEAVVSSSVFEYVPDVSLVLAECRRILPPGGWLLATVPNPRTPIRRLEACLRRLTPLVPAGLLGARLGRYIRYLALSRNRWSLRRWAALAEAAGFEWVNDDGASTPLVLLTLRRR
jgi:ubiquinone/menaquinone biosynthesis C-methylase UbiE